MKVKIPSRNKTPECELYVEIVRQSADVTDQLGHERLVMFMLPGGPGGNHTVYDTIKMSLSKYADLVLIDPRGCGLSSPTEARYCTIEESVNDINALSHELGIEKFILFGGSYGAMVSLSYAVTNCKNLHGLILVAGAPTGECFDTALKTLKKIGNKEQIALTKKLFAGKIESIEEKEKYYSIMRNIYLAESESARSNIPTIGKKLPYFLELSNFGHSTILPKYNVVKELDKISVPTLLLVGERDWINDKYAYLMNDLIANSELVVFPKAGHFIWQGIEDQFYKKIGTFISDKIYRLD